MWGGGCSKTGRSGEGPKVASYSLLIRKLLILHV